MNERTEQDDRLTRAEYMEMLEGQEIWSATYAGCVAIDDQGMLIMDGEIVENELSDDQLQILFNEYCNQELGFGYLNIILQVGWQNGHPDQLGASVCKSKL